MTRLRSDLEFILRQPGGDVRKVYERAAPRYGHFREAWLKLAGAGAEQAMQHYLAEILAPGQRVLDACGAGHLGARGAGGGQSAMSPAGTHTRGGAVAPHAGRDGKLATESLPRPFPRPPNASPLILYLHEFARPQWY